MTHKTRIFNASLITLLIVVGLFAGAFIARYEYLKQIDVMQSEFASVQNEMNATNKKLSKELNEVQDELKHTQENYQIEFNRAEQLSEDLNNSNKELNSVKDELNKANTIITDLKSNEYKLFYIGEYKLTHYCPGYHGEPCGTGDGLTATGTKVTDGRTIAVDPSVIPYGSKVYIEGYGWRVAEDCGGGVNGKHIDIAVDSHSQALEMGTKTGCVWILVKNNS